MLIDTNKSVSITTFNQQLSKVLKDVKEKKDIVIMKHNKPEYVIMDFAEYEKMKTVFLLKEADSVMEEYEKALKELAK